MCNFRRKIALGILLCLICVPLCIGQTDKVLSGRDLLKAMRSEDMPSVSTLLDRYTQALDSTSSFISDYEKTSEGSGRADAGSVTEKCFSRGQLRYDKQRIYENEYRWGDWASLTYTEDKSHYTINVVNSEMNYQNTIGRVGKRPGKVMWSPRPKGQNITLAAHFGVSYIGGYIGSYDERLDAILRKADRISVRQRTERVRGSKCFVIDADTKYGRYTIWLDTAAIPQLNIF